jgi:NitT/TauT family transport system substrate-binding protein
MSELPRRHPSRKGIVCLLVSAIALVVGGGMLAHGPKVGAAEPRSVKFAFHWNVPYAGWSGFYVAREKGYFRDEGIDLQFMMLPGSTAVVQVVGTGEASMGTATANSVLIARTKGVPVKSVLAYFQQTPQVIFSLKELNLTKPEDFVGKSVAVSIADPTMPLFFARLKRAGVDPTKVTVIRVQPEAVLPTMLAGRAHAMAGYLDYNLPIFKQEGKAYNALMLGDERINIYGPIVFGNERFIKENADLVKGIVRASVRGFLYARDHVDEVVDIYLKYNPEGKRYMLHEGTIIALGLADSSLVKRFGFGWQSAEDWASLQDALMEGQVIERKIPVEELFTNEFSPDIAKRW